MSQQIHTIEVPEGALQGLSQKGRLLVANLPGLANAVGGGAGASVVTAVSGLKNLPANYSVVVNPGQDATWFVSGKTSTGFNVTLNPRLAANTLAAGTFDVLIVG